MATAVEMNTPLPLPATMPTHGPPVLDYAPTTQPPGVSHATAAILKEGWMHKLSYMGSGWKKRYVAVTEDSELRYWAPTEIGGWELKGVITLEDAEFSQVASPALPLLTEPDIRMPGLLVVGELRSW